MVGAALRRFVALPYLAQNDRQAAERAEDLAASKIPRAVCPASARRVMRYAWAFAGTAPGANGTPLRVAKLLARLLGAPGAVARAAGTVVGVATRRGLLFEHDALHGTSLGVVAVSCS